MKKKPITFEYNCLIALKADTGERIWHFQTVHHDVWDRDLPANPNLVTITKDGKKIDAVAQITKHGFIFLFDREAGKPIFPIKEVPAPASDLLGEQTYPTQPIPSLPEPFVRQLFTEEEITNISPEASEYVRKIWQSMKKEHLFTPPSKQGTIIFPGFDGGGEWGGASFDKETGILYVNANEMAWILKIIDIEQADVLDFAKMGRNVYIKNCAVCHGENLEGNTGGNYPSLVNIKKKYKQGDIVNILNNGKGMMPTFKQLSDGEREALVAFLLEIEGKKEVIMKEISEKKKDKRSADVPYTITGYNRFFDQNGYPAIRPPWGTLNAIDLSSGKILWKVPLGEYEELTRQGIPITGTENYGGPITTKGGLIFIGASKDEKFRAFDKDNGKILWETKLPAAGYATPCTYKVKGKQYVVIAAGGGKIGTKSGDTYVAFALE